MNILAIDTVTQACSVALLTETQRYQQARFEANTHSAFVLGMVDGVLKEAALSLADIDLIAVNNGPGSFTGIRIGVGVAQGLAYGANIPVLGINALAVLAAQSTESGSILSMIDARMGQVYWATFLARPAAASSLDWQQRQLHLTKPEEVMINGRVQDLSIIACGCDHYKNRFGFYAQDMQADFDAYPLATELALLAASVNASEYQSADALTPVYLRNDVASVSRKKRL
ncbi:MAG: tRNA threonylcarbamoyladenosine biosynthesis protein TsaB [Gammaproteobacteria bacterium]|jgi:tRNA threonylcarbamoyladenosine biosynthesis protein TsaB